MRRFPRSFFALGALVVTLGLAAAGPRADAGRVALPPAFEFGPAHLVGSAPGGVGPMTSVRSTNWAGYVDRGRRFSYISASWTVPRLTCASNDSVASFWVGIDGYHSKTVEQAGTMGYCHDGGVSYFSWWQMYPAAIRYIGKSVHPGDKITASVTVTGHSYLLKVTDATHQENSFTRHATCALCQNASAEWIAERPRHAQQLYPLARFGHVTFLESKVGADGVRGSIKKYVHDAVTMINHNGATLAQVSDLQRGGNRFLTTWLRGE